MSNVVITLSFAVMVTPYHLGVGVWTSSVALVENSVGRVGAPALWM